MITNVYVDSFNLYYGLLKGSAYRWLDIQKLCQAELPTNQFQRIRCFSARVIARPDDPDQRNRQNAYFRALQTIPNLTLHLGHFLESEVSMRRVTPDTQGNKFALVRKTEEKGSDVNLASYLLLDGFKKEYEVAVVITNDSDLAEPIRIVRQELKLPVLVLHPCKVADPSRTLAGGRVSVELQRSSTKSIVIKEASLAASQFPDTLRDAQNRTITKPLGW